MPQPIESLESRHLFAITATLDSGQLSIIGTAHNDLVNVANLLGETYYADHPEYRV